MPLHTVNIKDFYLRTPPFSFNAIKPGDLAVFSNGKMGVIEKKIKPDNKGQCWYGLTIEGRSYVYDSGNSFDSSGRCTTGSCMDIKYIIKTGIKLRK